MNKLKRKRFTGKWRFYKSFEYKVSKLTGLRRLKSQEAKATVSFNINGQLHTFPVISLQGSVIGINF
jgi:hypothetical protein